MHTLEDERLSTVVRFHTRERLAFLEEALFSLALQTWREHETVVVIQNGDEELVGEVGEMVARQPWPAEARHKVVRVEIPAGVDGRSTLLTRGIEEASGRYLAFLDDDDLVYQHGYATLVGRLRESGAAVAVGGCRTARVRRSAGGWYVETKENPFAWGRTRLDLIRDNFIPVHSYVVDRARVEESELYFDDTMPPLEDYDFLLRLCARHEFDFAALDTPVCEYRIHGENSIPYDPNAPESARSSHLRAQRLIGERKRTLLCSVPASELAELQQRLAERAEENEYLRWRLNVSEEEKKQRLLLRAAYRVYEFFGRRPRLEKFLSDSTHRAWAAHRRRKR